MIEYVPSMVIDGVVPVGYEKLHSYQFMLNKHCEFYPCHKQDVALNCMFCFCPLFTVECGGDYTVFADEHGEHKKDCSSCTLNHRPEAHDIIMKALELPVPWVGSDHEVSK